MVDTLMPVDFPDDANGDVLRRMQENGDDFDISRAVDFTVVFRQRLPAEQFSEEFQRLGYATSIEHTGSNAEFPWDVMVTKHMLPSHEAITLFEDELDKVAARLGGRNDGWGCLIQKQGSMRK